MLSAAHPCISLNNISKSYVPPWQFSFRKPQRQPVQALKDVSCTIPAGQICGLLGTNGAGKTTLIKILATLLLPDAGEIRINGVNPIHAPLEVKAMVGLVATNERSFYWRLSAQENLRFFATLHGITGHERRQRIAQLLSLVQLEHKQTQPFMTLSTGQRQRLALARALLASPSILLLDEPTTGLDPVAAERFKDFVLQNLVQEQKKTILWCTHNLPEAEQLCAQILLLHEGRIVHSIQAQNNEPESPAPTTVSDHGVSSKCTGDHRTDKRLQGAGDVRHWPVQPTHVGKQADSTADSVPRDRLPTTCRIVLHAEDTSLVNELELAQVQIRPQGDRAELRFASSEAEIPDILQALINKGARVYSCSTQQASLQQFFARLQPQEGQA